MPPFARSFRRAHVGPLSAGVRAGSGVELVVFALDGVDDVGQIEDEVGVHVSLAARHPAHHDYPYLIVLRGNWSRGIDFSRGQSNSETDMRRAKLHVRARTSTTAAHTSNLYVAADEMMYKHLPADGGDNLSASC